MKKVSSVLVFALIVTFVVGLLVQAGCAPKAKESLYDRVMRTKEVRTSYVINAPYCFRDAASGEMTGVFVDVLNAIGQKLELKVTWVEEVEAGAIFDSLDTDRYDVFGAGLSETPANSQRGLFSKPLFYNGVQAWVGAKNKKIAKLEDLNLPETRIAIQQGSVDEMIANANFPLAQKIIVPSTTWSDVLNYVVADSADVSLIDAGLVAEYLAMNPGTLKPVNIGDPLRGYGNGYAFKAGEVAFKDMIDKAIDEMTADGTIEQILLKYETAPGQFLRAAAPAAPAEPAAPETETE